VLHDLLADGVSCGLHRIERLMRLQALRARPRRRRLPPDLGERQATAVAVNVLDRSFEAAAPNRKWIADFVLDPAAPRYRYRWPAAAVTGADGSGPSLGLGLRWARESSARSGLR
jgi:transposase InsO family protein